MIYFQTEETLADMEWIEKTYTVSESISGNWHYHLSEKGNTSKALCGAPTMFCHLPISTWGYVGRLKERYCDKCLKIIMDNNESIHRRHHDDLDNQKT